MLSGLQLTKVKAPLASESRACSFALVGALPAVPVAAEAPLLAPDLQAVRPVCGAAAGARGAAGRRQRSAAPGAGGLGGAGGRGRHLGHVDGGAEGTAKEAKDRGGAAGDGAGECNVFDVALEKNGVHASGAAL